MLSRRRYLRVGDKVPCDARLVALRTTSFSTEESSLTGESVAIQKDARPLDDAGAKLADKRNCVFAGTMVTPGAALAVVTATGMRTEIGKIQAGVTAAKDEEEKTPLAQKLDEFGQQLTLIIAGVCAAVWLINIPKVSPRAAAARAAAHARSRRRTRRRA